MTAVQAHSVASRDNSTSSTSVAPSASADLATSPARASLPFALAWLWLVLALSGGTVPVPHAAFAGWVLLGGLALKLALEALTQPQKQAGPPGWLGGPVLIEAHWAGTLAGLIVYVAWRALSHQRAVAAQAPGAERE